MSGGRLPLRVALAAAAFVLAVIAAAPASAQHAHWLRGGVTTVHSSNLNGLEVEIGMNGATFSSGFNGMRSINGQLQSSVLGVPAGMTARVCAGSHNVGLNTRGIYAPAERGWIRLCTTGDFFEDWEMRIRVRRTSSNSWFNGLNEYTFGPITVRAQNTQSTMALSDNSISENGGESTVTATLSQPQATPVTITVATTPFSDTGMSASDYTLSSPSTLTIAAGSTTSTGTVTITAVDNSATAAAKTMRISGTITGGDGVGVRPPASLFLRITDDETSASATPTLALSSSSIAEAGGVATVTATLDQTISDQVRVWVYTAPAAGAPPGGFNQSSTILLTIAAGATASTGTVTITAVDDDVYTAGRTVRVFGQARGGNTANPADVTLTITDNEVRPTATLALSSSSIAEAGGETTVTATLSATVIEALVLTVSASPGSGTDFTVSSADTLTIAAGATTSTGTVTITATADTTDSPDKSVAVSAAAAGGNGVAAPADVTLTITDDDDPPDVTLTLSDNSISENGGTSVVSATLSHASSAATTITVTAVSGAFTVPSGASGRIEIPAGDTTAASSTVTITAANNDVHSGNRTATVTGTIANGQGTGSVTGGGVSLTLEEDETLPTAALALSETSISENGGVATVTATLSGESSAAVTITVGAAPGTGAAAADFTLSGATTLTIAAGATTSTGAVTVTANDNTAQTGSKQVTVSGTAAGGNNVADPSSLTLTLTDDDAPTPTLALSASSIGENAGEATVTATLDRVPSVAVTITVGAAAGTNAVAGDFTLSGAITLTIAASTTTSTGTVTVTAVDNDTDAPDKTVTVSGTSSDSLSLANDPASVTLTITDDDDPPDVTLSLSAASIAENGGTSVVSAVLSRPSSAATTVTVTGVSGAFTVPTGASGRIVFAAGDTTSTDTVTITAVDDDVDSPNRTPTVSATMANAQGTGSVTGATLTLTDDESTPTVTLSASAASISENGGTSAISAELSGKSSEATTVTVTAAMGAAYTVASGAATIVLAAGATTSADTVTVTAVNNDVDAANNAVTVTGTAANGHGVGAVTGASLTITDDDTAGLAVVPSTSTSSRLRTTEAGGQATFTVALASEPTGNVSVSVASSDTAQGTASTSSLTFTPSDWDTAQTVTLTGVDDDHPVNNPGGSTDGSQTYTVTLTSSSTTDAPYNGIAQVTVYAINADDELGLDVGAVTGQATEAGGTATFTVALLTQPSEAVTVAVSSLDSSEGRASPSSMTFSTSNWNVDQTVTVTGLDDDVDDGNVPWAVRLDPSSGDADYNGLANVDVSVTTTDDDEAALTVSPTPSTTQRLQTTEAGGRATFTVRLATEPTGNVVLDVASALTAEGTVSPAMLTFTASTWATAQTVTLTGADDDVDDGDRNYTATLTVNQTNTADSNYDALAAVTVYAANADDDEAGVTVSRGTSSTQRLRTREDGGTDTFTVTLDSEPTGNVVLDVASSDTDQGVVDTDSVMNGLQSALTFTPSNWNTAQTVTLTGVDDDPGLPDGSQDYEVTLTVNTASTVDTNYDALSAVTVYARNLDDEAGVEVSVAAGTTLTTTEAGRTATFTVTLLSEPQADVTIPVTSSDTDEGVASPSSLTFTTGNYNTPQTVTVTGVDDAIDDGDVAYAIEMGDPSSADATYDGLSADDVDDVSVVNEDDEATPGVTLAVSPASIAEAGGVATVTARLSHPSSAVTRVTVAATAGVFGLGDNDELIIAAGETASTGVVTVTAENNDVDAPDAEVTVTGSATNARAAADGATMVVTGAELIITDDDRAGFAFARAGEAVRGLDAPANDPVAYTLALTSMPTATVSVAVAAGNTSLTLSTAGLTFAPDDWNTPQTVTVTAAAGADDSANEASWVSHRASGGGYDDEPEFRLPVSVQGETAVRIKETPGTTTYAIEGREVTVTVEAGVPAGIELDFAGVGRVAADATPKVTLSAEVSASVVARAAGNGFNLGAAGSRVVVDIDVAALAGERRVCLPVTLAVDGVEGAADRLQLLRYDEGRGAWEAVTDDREYDAAAGRICATVAAFSPFATGYADTTPSFGDYTVAAMVFTVDDAIAPVTLREAAGGDPPVTHALTGPGSTATTLRLPEGLRWDAATRTLSGTPTVEFEAQAYRWTARDADGHSRTLTFTIEVIPALAMARERLKRINESILPELSRAMWGSALEAVTGRLASPDANEALGSSLARALQAQEKTQHEGVSLRDLAAGRTFAVGLRARGDGEDGGMSDPRFGGAVLWGGGSRRSLSLDKDALDWSGDLFSAHLGVDAPLGERVRAGLAASWFEGQIEYTDRSGDAAVTGVHDSRMTALHPYLGWSGSDGAQLWGALGYGAGEIEITDAEVVERFGVQKGDSEFLAAAAGGSVPVLSAGRLTLALKGSGEATQYSVEDNGNAIAAVSVATQRLRLSAEGSRAYALTGGGSFTPSLELGGRWDAGDGETGIGVEVGGGVEWVLPSPGLTVAARGRILAAHAGAVEEWGASGSARLAPGFGGRGLSFALSPRWGASESGIERLWKDGSGSSSDRADAASASLETELGYGFGVPGPGLLTPYGGFGFEQGGARSYRLGTRLGFAPAIDLGLEAKRKETATTPEHALRIDLRIRW